MARAARILFATLVRGLAAIGGALTAYGATGMFTTSGIGPPNAIVLAGLAACLAVATILLSRDRSVRGLWPALLIVGVPYALYAWGSFGLAECPEPHPPISPNYSCAPVGTHLIGIVAPVVALVGVGMFVLDIRALARR